MTEVTEIAKWVKTHKNELIQDMVKETGVEPDAEPGAFFMAGLPGAGKTEISRNIIKGLKLPILRIDMAPKQNQKFTMKELTAREKSPAVKAFYDQVLVDAYKEQQKILKKAEKISKQ